MTDKSDFLAGMETEQELEDLLVQRNELDKRIKELQGKLRGNVITKIKKLVDDYELSAEDIIGIAPTSSTSAIKKQRKPRKAPAYIYVNPSDGSQVFKGIGAKPAWLKQMTKEQQEACKRPSSDSLALS